MEFLNSEPYYANKKIVNQSSEFPVRRTGSYRHKKALIRMMLVVESCALLEERETGRESIDTVDLGLHTKVKYTDTAVHSLTCLMHRYGNSYAIEDHTVLPATRQRLHSRLYPRRSWYSIKRPRRDAKLS